MLLLMNWVHNRIDTTCSWLPCHTLGSFRKFCQSKNDGGSLFIGKENMIFFETLFPKIFSIQNEILHLLTFLESRIFYNQNEEINTAEISRFQKCQKMQNFTLDRKVSYFPYRKVVPYSLYVVWETPSRTPSGSPSVSPSGSPSTSPTTTPTPGPTTSPTSLPTTSPSSVINLKQFHAKLNLSSANQAQYLEETYVFIIWQRQNQS